MSHYSVAGSRLLSADVPAAPLSRQGGPSYNGGRDAGACLRYD